MRSLQSRRKRQNSTFRTGQDVWRDLPDIDGRIREGNILRRAGVGALFAFFLVLALAITAITIRFW